MNLPVLFLSALLSSLLGVRGLALVSDGQKSSRRQFVIGTVCGSFSPLLIPSTSHAVDLVSPDDAKVTQKVFMKVRISRQDGTFYVRDDLPDTPENRVFQGQLTIGLFGNNAPETVQKFLSYLQPENPLDDNPLPSYGRSVFPALDQASGLITGGVIPSLEYVDVNQNPALKYSGRLLAAPLWLEKGSNIAKVSHIGKGLLTHRNLNVLPDFQITTRRDNPLTLDRSHTVFGKIIPDESSNEFLEIVQDLPTYTLERPTTMTDPTKESVVDDAAQSIFNAQRGFFRKAAQTFGDTRVSKVYEGKILRRVEVTQVGLL